jgi:hypothetical protein
MCQSYQLLMEQVAQSTSFSTLIHARKRENKLTHQSSRSCLNVTYIFLHSSGNIETTSNKLSKYRMMS